MNAPKLAVKVSKVIEANLEGDLFYGQAVIRQEFSRGSHSDRAKKFGKG